MSGDLWQMARSGITLLPGEAVKLALAHDDLRQKYHDALAKLDECEKRCAMLATLIASGGQTALDVDQQTALG